MGETFIVLGETILVLGETICAKLVMGETRYNLKRTSLLSGRMQTLKLSPSVTQNQAVKIFHYQCTNDGWVGGGIMVVGCLIVH